MEIHTRVGGNVHLHKSRFRSERFSPSVQVFVNWNCLKSKIDLHWNVQLHKLNLTAVSWFLWKCRPLDGENLSDRCLECGNVPIKKNWKANDWTFFFHYGNRSALIHTYNNNFYYMPLPCCELAIELQCTFAQFVCLICHLPLCEINHICSKNSWVCSSITRCHLMGLVILVFMARPLQETSAYETEEWFHDLMGCCCCYCCCCRTPFVGALASSGNTATVMENTCGELNKVFLLQPTVRAYLYRHAHCLVVLIPIYLNCVKSSRANALMHTAV